jgi:G3E family GTPase
MSSHESEAGAPMARVPVTVLSGFRGAGKSTLAAHVSRVRTGARVALIIDEGAPPEALAARVHALASTGAHDVLVIELSGDADASSVAVALDAPDVQPRAAILDTWVAVVDAGSLLADFCSSRCADALTEQIELANVIVLNKLDGIEPTAKAGLVALLTALNPVATILQCQFGCVSPGAVLRRHHFRLDEAHASPGWAKALAGAPIPNADRHGISAFVYCERRPFHPERFTHFLNASWPGVVRSKGVFWIATRPDWAADLSQAGGSRRYRAVTSWWAATLEGKAFEPQQIESFLGIPWDPLFGDRRQELAFVGIGLNERELRARLDACLLSDDELRRGPELWQTFTDPLPPWGLVAITRSAASCRKGGMQ